MTRIKHAFAALSLVALCAFGPPNEKVFICISPKAYAYHQVKSCNCLQRCTHEIREVSLKEAKKAGKDKPCGCCYK